MSQFEEIDIGIIEDFRSIGCNIPADVDTLNPKFFVADILAAVIFRSLKFIDPENEYPRALSKSRAQKVHQATQIVLSLQNFGFMDSLSYHCILYPNEGDSRKILMFLQERLPEPEVRIPATDFKAFVDKSIDTELEKLSSSMIWTPDFIGLSRHYHDKVNYSSQYLFTPFSPVYRNSKDIKRDNNEYLNTHIPLVSKQTDSIHHLFSSLLEFNMREHAANQAWEDEWNLQGLDVGLESDDYKSQKKKSILSDMAEHIRNNLDTDYENKQKSSNIDDLLKSFQTIDADNQYLRELKFRKEQEVVETEIDIETRRQLEKEAAEKQLADLEHRIRTMESEVQMFFTEILQKKGLFKKLLEDLELLEAQYQEKEQTIQLLDNPEENAARLKDNIDKRKKKIKTMGAKWEQRRRALIDSYREARDRFSNREETVTKKLAEIKDIRKEMKDIKSVIDEKESMFKELGQVYKKLPDEQRTTYTVKIMELVKNVKKQSGEIKRILTDTKSLQKEINTLTDRLNRTFALVEDQIFADAEKDKSAAEAYKLLANINTEYQRITDKITQTGTTTNATLNLEDKIEKLEERISGLDIDTVETDYNEIINENTEIITRIEKMVEKINA